MICRLEDLKCKEIINVKSGCKLGFADDIEFDTCTAKVCKLIIFGRPKFFGLLGREEDRVIPWCNIDIIGEETILVNCDCPDFPRAKNGLRGFFR